jgi:hypothetical protein
MSFILVSTFRIIFEASVTAFCQNIFNQSNLYRCPQCWSIFCSQNQIQYQIQTTIFTSKRSVYRLKVKNSTGLVIGVVGINLVFLVNFVCTINVKFIWGATDLGKF